MSGSSEQSFKSKVEKAAEGHYYIHVFRKDGKLRTSHIKLSGYRQMFVKDPEFIYAYSLRHAGRMPELVEYMTSLGFEDSAVRTYLQDAYNASNADRMAGDIHAELSSVPVVRKEVKKTMSLDEIISLKPLLDAARVSASGAKTADEIPAPSTPKATTTRSRTDLKSRVDALEEDKVLDISHYDSVRNNGIKTVKRTVKGVRRPLAASGNLSRVVFDFGRDVEIAVAALVSMGMTNEAARSSMTAAQSVKSGGDLSKVAISPRR